jgi:hypothetical protein
MATITLTLPDDLAQAAAELGLLDSTVLANILQAEVRLRAYDEIRVVSERLSAAGTPPMTDEEIQAEIRAARADERAACS